VRAAAGMRDPLPNATTKVQEGLRAHHEASFAERRCQDTYELRLCGQRDSTQTWDNQPWLCPTAHWAPVTKGRPTAQGSMAASPQGRHCAPVSSPPGECPSPGQFPKAGAENTRFSSSGFSGLRQN